MVQFFRMGNPQGKLSEVLGMSLGQGLGSGLNTYFANKALDDVLNDKSNINAPVSDRLGKLQAALAPYGEQGQNLLAQRMQIELQAEQEKQVLEHQKRQFQQQRELQQQKDEAALERISLKPPPGGLTGQSVPQEVSNKIGQVLANSHDLNADQLKQAFDVAGVPPIYSNQYVENRRQEAKPIFEPESEKLEAKRVADYATQIEKDFLAAKNENIRLDRQLELSNKGGLSTPLMAKLLDSFGIPIGVLSNSDTEEFRKLETDFIRDVRDIFPGGRITNYEVQSYLKTIPTLLNSKAGREAIIRNRKLFNDAKEIRYQTYKDILKENKGKKPANLFMLLEDRVADKISVLEDQFKAGIEKEINKTQQPIRMVDPQGNPIDIPPNLIEKAMKAGARFG